MEAKKKWLLKITLVIFALTAGIFFSCQSTDKQTFKVIEVTDGDTIKAKSLKGKTQAKGKLIKIRYIGIDAPELGKGNKKDDCFALKAKKLNEKLVLGKDISLEFDLNKMDRFGRYLAYVYTTENNVFINQYLLEHGAGEFRLDTVNLKYQDELIEAAKKGHKEKQGLWRECAQDPKLGCIIKGNVDRMDKRYYHLPYFRHYSQIIMRLDKGDRWFCTEKSAIEAGFKKARE